MFEQFGLTMLVIALQLDHEIVLEVTGLDMLILGLRMNLVKRFR